MATLAAVSRSHSASSGARQLFASPASRHDQAIWLISDGRSGSTWFSQLLNFTGHFHIEHEPIHRNFNPRLADQPLMPFPADDAFDSHYLPLFDDILAGRYQTHRFGETGGGHGGLIIRDIHGLLIAPRMLEAFPELKPVVMVRHPAEVAASKVALGGWDWFSDTERFLQDRAVRREMTGLSHLIEGADTPYRRYVIHWAASHRYLFSSINPRQVQIVRYPGDRADITGHVDQVFARIGVEVETGSRLYDRAWRTRSATERPQGTPGLFQRVFNRQRPSARDLDFTEMAIDAFGLRWLVPWTAYADQPEEKAAPFHLAARRLTPALDDYVLAV